MMAYFHSLKSVQPCLALFCLLFGYAAGFFADSMQLTIRLQLTLEPEEIVEAFTENVTLRCELNASETIKVEEFSVLRILKHTSSGSPDNKWITIMEKKDVKMKDAFAEIIWPVAVDETFGEYHCDALGRTEQSDVVLGRSDDLYIKPNEVTTNDLLYILKKTKLDLQDSVHEISEKVAEVDQSLETLIKKENKRSRTVQTRLMVVETVQDTVFRKMLFPNSTIRWPGGTYALLQPASGCPLDFSFYGGHSGYFKIHAESTSGSNFSSYDSNTHMAQPILTTSGHNTFVTLRFCSANGAFNSGSWPSGKYCINQGKSSCPAEFRQGYTMIYTEETNNQDEKGGNAPQGMPSKMYFCCRSDANPPPMELPLQTPFYLFRYGSKCQEIKGMNVTLDFFEIGTEKKTVCHGSCPYFIPKDDDSVRFELCYYSKS